MPKYNDDNLEQNGTSTAKDVKKQQEQDASTKAAKVAAKGAATYFGGAAGGKAVDLASKTKAGQKILNEGGKKLNSIPGMGKAAKKLDDSGALDKADNALSLAGGKGGPKGGGQGSLPSSASGNNMPGSPGGVPQQDQQVKKSDGNIPKEPLPEPKKKDQDSDKEEKEKKKGAFGGLLTKQIVKIAIAAIIIVVILIFLIVVPVITVSTTIFGDFGDAFGVSMATGEETGEVDYESDPEAKEFYERINEVKLDYQEDGKTVDALLVVAVYHVLSVNDANVSYKNFSKYEIEDIADAMFDGTSYDEDVFRDNLMNDIFPYYFPRATDAELEGYVDDVFTYVEDYYSLIGKEEEMGTCATSGTCVYDIKGFRTGKSSSKKVNMQVEDLKVRLMQCGTTGGVKYGSGKFGKPLDGEALVPFEKYILGVAYQEIGPGAPDEAIKAQMVAARSYALIRPTTMGNALGKKLAEENGQWILQLCACVADQVYCDPDQGCSAMNDGDQGGTVRSGTTHGKKMKGPMPEDHKMRELASATQGEVLVDDKGYIVNSGYTSTEQKKFSSLAKQGYNYKQILLEIYNNGSRNVGAADIEKMSCGGGSSSNCVGSTGPYADWMQFGAPWSGINLGSSSSTIGSAGCLVTSVSMLIAKSGVPVKIQGDFNPGTFVKFLNKNGGFEGALFVWGSVSKAAPNFKYKDYIPVSGLSRDQKLSKLKSLLNKGAYVVAEVKGPTGQHWVAVDGISGNDVLMMDPASKETIMWKQYPWQNTSQFSYFMVEN